MSEDKDVLIQLTDDEDDNAKAAAEDTARLLIDIHDQHPADAHANEINLEPHPPNQDPKN